MKHLLVLIASAALLSGCGLMGGGTDYTPDLTLLPDYVHEYYCPVKVDMSDSVDLYVDYSTCVAEAGNSSYYKATHPSIVDCSPTFWSIKGKAIKKETEDRQRVYQLLSTISEVNHADIKQAVRNIVNGNRQAVLITDGEYYMQGAVRDNLNNPYLAEEFRIWLRAGRDVYIYSEPYLEKGRYNKYRYYMLFTDADLPNNINDRFARSAPQDDRVKMLHLSNGVPSVSFAKIYPDINVALSPVEDNCRMDALVDIQEYGVDWSDMYAYLDKDYHIKDKYVLRGLFVDKLPSDCYKIEEIEPVVYQMYDAYQEYCDSVYVEGAHPKARQLKEVKDVFDIDEDIFEETGEIVLCLDDDFDGVGNMLSSETPNLLKVDFVIKEVSDNFSNNPDLNGNYRWNSISAAQGHAENTSIFESISQVIKDPYMSPVRNGAVIHTVYISSSRL